MNIRTATWSHIGQDISTANSVEEALHLAHLDYTVEKAPLFLEDGTPVSGAFATTKSIKDRLMAAQQVLVANTEYLTEFQKTAIKMAGEKVTPKDVNSWMDTVLDINPEAITRKDEEKREALLTAYRASDNANFVGTQWGLINAYADYITHRPMTRDTDTARANRFIKTTLKRGFNDVLRATSRLS